MRLLKLLSIFIFLFSFIVVSAVENIADDKAHASVANNVIKFTENKKQWNAEILYRAQLDGGSLFFLKNALVYNFYDKEALRANHLPKISPNNNHKALSENKIKSHAFKAVFLNSSLNTSIEAVDTTTDFCNYFIGNDKNKWASNVRNYKELNYKNLYNGIDMQVVGLQNSIKYNYYVSPIGKPEQIQLLYDGLSSITLEKGALKIQTSINEITEQRPFAYQWIGGKRIEIACEFTLVNNVVGFSFPKGYTKGVELVIDPVLIFASSSGSTADNFGMTATYDLDGNLYSGGTAFSQGFPTTLGAYDVTYNGTVQSGRTDVVVTKYNALGNALLYSTYLGGATSTEIVSSLVVNAQNELMLLGVTGSTDFPTTTGAYDVAFAGGSSLSFLNNGTEYSNGTDIYVSKFSADGTALLASTFVGGDLNDGVNSSNSLIYNYGDYYRGEIQIDAFGNCYVASCTYSANFPVTSNAYQNANAGGMDGVIFKMNSNLSNLIWSTYIGGTNDEGCYAIAIDDSLNVYTTGGTSSTNFPTTLGALNTSYSGGITDGYVASIKNNGTSLISSTFIGTSQYDQSFFIQLDKSNDIYIVGQTLGNMPVSSGVYSNANSKQFIWKMNNSLTNTIFTTNFGNGDGNINISPSAFLVDYCENIYVSGWGGHILNGTPTTNMPLTNDAIQPTTDGFNFYLIVLSTDATSLLYATYFGGAQSWEHVDGGTSRFDKKGIIYQSVCAGCGANDDFPVTPGAWPNTGADVNYSSNCNNGTFKFDFQIPIVSANFTVNYANGCSPVTITFENQSSPGSTYLWDFGGGDTSSVLNPTVTYTNPGTYLVMLYVNDPTSCNLVDTAYQYITVYPSINADFDFSSSTCSSNVAFADSSFSNPVSWLWYFGDGDSSTIQNPTHSFDTTGVYDVQLIATNSDGCKDTAVVQVNFNGASPISISANQATCLGNGVQLLATGGLSYVWSPAESLSNASIASPFATPDTTTTYTVAIQTLNGFGDTCTQNLSTTVFVSNPSLFVISATVDEDTILEGETTVLHALTDTSYSIQWLPAQTLSDSIDFDPIASPQETTTYSVSIVDSSGCTATASVTVYVVSMKCEVEAIFVPNTFTPNGDGKNDVLYVRGNQIDEIYFAIYNRWGEKVFETNTLSEGWDGYYNSQKLDPAVFAWYLSAKCYNGNSIEKKGNVTLIR